MNLYVIRHAKTPANAQRIINGQHDELLSDEGRAQLPGIVQSLHGYVFEVMYVSPLKRTTATAMPIAEDHHVPIIIDRRLVEVDAGLLEGKTYDVTIKEFGLNSSDLLSTYRYDFTQFGGESSAQVEARVRAFIKDVQATDYKSVLVVTHGGILRWIHRICTGTMLEAQPNGSIHEYTI